jgi:zinc transporter ZupT
MELIEALYAVFSITLGVAGLSVVALAIRAYVETRRTSMLHLSIGFVLIVAAALGTTISAFLVEFANARSLLTVNYAFTTGGFLFVIYSIVARS